MTNHTYPLGARPGWLNEMSEAKRTQRRAVFLLHFNIRDIVFDPDCTPESPGELLTVNEFLAKILAARDVVLSYSLHGGIELHLPQKDSHGDNRMRVASTKPSLDKCFAARDGRLWEEVAEDAANRPFLLVLGQGGTADNPKQPYHWRTPGPTIQLLTRALTHQYSVLPGNASGERTSGQSQPLSLGLIIDYLHHLTPGPGVFTSHAVPELVEALQRWSTDPQLPEHDHIVITLSPELAAVHPELRGSDSRIGAIRIPRPEYEERQKFLGWLAGFEDYAALRIEKRVQEVVRQTSGMNYSELRDFARTMTLQDGSDWKKLLADRRAEIIQRESGGLLVPRESQFGLNDVAGYGYVREYVDRLIARLQDGRADLTGVLFAGPPGTGKSFYAAAIAQDASVNMVVMRNIRNMYVGQSERNLEQVLEVARSLEPVIIFVDEIDQAFSNRRGMNNDSGVEQRLLGRLLEFMDDKQNLGKVIWIAASNRPDLIDEALLSRFKLRIPFLLPDREACCALLHTQLPHQAGFAWQGESWDDEVERWIEEYIVGRYSGRELETIVRMALWHAQADMAIKEDREAWARHRADYLADTGVEPPATPIRAAQGRTNGEAHAFYLCQSIKDASAGHNEAEYTRQALLALQSIPRDSSALVEAVKTALPPDIVRQVINEERIDKRSIARLLKQSDF